MNDIGNMKHYKDFNLLQRLMLSAIQFIEKKLYKREWTYEDQVVFARREIFNDHQWMYHNNIVSAVNERHSAMLSEDWYKTHHQSQDSFRDSVGLNPHRVFNSEK